MTVPSVVGETAQQAVGDLESQGFHRQPAAHLRQRPERARHRPGAEPGRRHHRDQGIDGDDRGRPALAGPAPGDDDHDHHQRRSVSQARRLRVAILAGGRSSEHEISLASARSVAAALDPERYEIAEIAIGRDGRWFLEPAPLRPRPCLSRTRAARSRSSAPSTSCPDPARPARRGRHGAGVARARQPAVRRRRRSGLSAGDGQGPVQEGHARQRHPRGRAPYDPARRHGREPVRLPGLRQAGATGLVRRDLEGAGRGGSLAPAVELAFRHDEEGARRRVRRRNRGRGRRARQPRRRPSEVAGPARRSRPCRRPRRRICALVAHVRDTPRGRRVRVEEPTLTEFARLAADVDPNATSVHVASSSWVSWKCSGAS